MAPPSPKEFIEAALFSSSPYALSYSDAEQKWLIQRHLLTFLQEYSGFKPSIGQFTHNDGTQVNLLYASGYVQTSNSTPPIPLIIWIHENYPQMAPLVFVPLNPMNPIHIHHPFVDNTSGSTSPPYILTWKYPPCNLSCLLRNLVHLFSRDHPFSFTSSTTNFNHPSFVSPKEALDRLVGMLYYDIIALQAKTSEEIEELSLKQEILKRRDYYLRNKISEMEQEKNNLKERLKDWAEESDRLVNWLRVNDGRLVMDLIDGDVEIEDVFEMDESSRERVESVAADFGIEDVLYKLDKALEQEAVSFESYIRQVRSLAREQFFHRAKLNGKIITAPYSGFHLYTTYNSCQGMYSC